MRPVIMELVQTKTKNRKFDTTDAFPMGQRFLVDLDSQRLLSFYDAGTRNYFPMEFVNVIKRDGSFFDLMPVELLGRVELCL